MSNIGETLYVAFWLTIYIIILVAFFIVLFYFIARRRRGRREDLTKFNLTFLLIKMPPQNEIEIKAAEQFFANLYGFRKSWWRNLWSGKYRISFEIVSNDEGISFYVVVPDEIATSIEKQINGTYPSAEIDIVDPNEVWDRGEFTSVSELKLTGVPFFPIKTHEDLTSDPMSPITSALSKLGKDEVIAIQYVIQPAGGAWREQGRRFVTRVRARGADPERKVSVDTSFVEGVEKKIGKPGFDVSIRVVSIAKDKTTADAHIQNVVAAFEQFSDANYNKFKRVNPRREKKLVDNFIYRKIKFRDFHIPVLDVSIYRNTPILNIEEMATIFHFPNKDVQTPNIVWLTSRKASAPPNIPTEGLYLGKNIFRGAVKKVYMLQDDRNRHFYIIGQTGTGKSEFMKTLAIQDVHNGEGLAFIDPHGSDIDDLLQKIPRERIEDVILFDVSDVERPMGLNILEADSEEHKNIIINAFIDLLYKLYDPNRQGIMGPQLERAIRNVMLTAMTDPDSTLIDVLRLLIDPNYSKTFIPKLTDPLVRRYWTDEIAKTSDFHKSEKMGYFVSKFDRFVTERIMRNILGQKKSAFNFKEIMAQRKILLVDLSKGKIGEENSNFIGLILVPRILAAALSRARSLGKEEFPDFYLYVDEFQNFATPDFATILSEARKYKLNLVVAHQFIEQLSEEIRDAVFGNVGTIASFRVGADDAEYLEGQFDPVFNESDLINLPVGSYYTRLLVKGHPTVPFSMQVDWDMVNSTPKDLSIADEIRKRSKELYGVPVSEVEAYINERAGFNEQPQQPEFEERKRKIPF